MLIKNDDYIDHRFWEDHGNIIAPFKKEFLIFHGSLKVKEKDPTVPSGINFVDVYSYQKDIIVRYGNSSTHYASYDKVYLPKDLVKYPNMYPILEKVVKLYLQSSSEQVQGNTCSKCKAEIKERMLFLNKFVGCMC